MTPRKGSVVEKPNHKTLNPVDLFFSSANHYIPTTSKNWSRWNIYPTQPYSYLSILFWKLQLALRNLQRKHFWNEVITKIYISLCVRDTYSGIIIETLRKWIQLCRVKLGMSLKMELFCKAWDFLKKASKTFWNNFWELKKYYFSLHNNTQPHTNNSTK